MLRVESGRVTRLWGIFRWGASGAGLRELCFLEDSDKCGFANRKCGELLGVEGSTLDVSPEDKDLEVIGFSRVKPQRPLLRPARLSLLWWPGGSIRVQLVSYRTVGVAERTLTQIEDGCGAMGSSLCRLPSTAGELFLKAISETCLHQDGAYSTPKTCLKMRLQHKCGLCFSQQPPISLVIIRADRISTREYVRTGRVSETGLITEIETHPHQSRRTRAM